MTLFLIPGNDLIRAEDIKSIEFVDGDTMFIYWNDFNRKTVIFPDEKSAEKAYKCLLGNHYSQWNAYIDSFGYESSGRETKLKNEG